MTDLAALLEETRRLSARDRSVGSAAMTRLAELAVALADAVEEQWRAYDGGTIGAVAAEVLRLDAEATPGPWDTERQWAHLDAGDPSPIEVWTRENILGCASVVVCEDERDVPLIATYRTAAPALAREVARLQARIAALEGGIVAEARRATAEADGLQRRIGELETMILAAYDQRDGALRERDALLRVRELDNKTARERGRRIDALEAELATERGKRCGSCRFYIAPEEHFGGVCGYMGSPREPEQGCTEWEAKG